MNTQLEQMQQMKKMVLVSSICMIILLFWGNFNNKTQQNISKTETKEIQNTKSIIENETAKIIKFESRDKAISNRNDGQIIKFENDAISGSINLKGLKIDDLTLKNYRQEEDKAKNIELLSPISAPDYYYIDFGWISNNKSITLPTKETIWAAIRNDKNDFTFTSNIDKNQFIIKLKLDDKYLWSIKMFANGLNMKDITSYTRLKRSMENIKTTNSYSHEGILLVKNDILNEEKYSNIKNKQSFETSSNSWIGFGDKYWFNGIISIDGNVKNISYTKTSNCKTCYQLDMKFANENSNFMLYTGAKELNVIKKYHLDYNIPLFDRVIDFGWFYFLTKPLLGFIKILYNICGNFGVAIILFTVVIRLALFPLAHKSYKSMAKLKKVAPKMKELKEKFGNDKKAFNVSVVELYRKEKVNPAAGCLPLILQIPVFFALYKVLIVSIEMRDSPFVFWLKDLSESDPTSIFNLFGLLPYVVPKFLQIGILPIFMGFTLFLQQKFNPQPADPNQAKMMKVLPFLFTFLFAGFPSGLVLYWSVNNLISISQQWLVSKIEK